MTEEQKQKILDMVGVVGVSKKSGAPLILLSRPPSKDLIDSVREALGTKRFLFDVVGDIKLL